MDNTSQTNNKKLFVGNLSFQATEADLEQLFAQYGEIAQVTLISDRMTGRSKGFAFVEFTTEEAAQAAAQALNEQPFMDRNMVVNVARPQAPRENRSFGGGSRGGFGGGSRGGSRGGYGGQSDNRGGGYR